MEVDKRKTCIACRWFETAPGETDKGRCKARSPQVTQQPVSGVGGTTMLPIGAWPIVGGKSWCGEFESALVIGSN